jgi:hypothetical protein
VPCQLVPGCVTPPIWFLSISPRVCSTLPSDPISRRRPCASLSLRLHPAGKRTFTSKLCNMLGTHAQSSAARPLWAASGYRRRGNHSPRLWFKTVHAGFLAHGSSAIRPLSWAPCWACALHVGASPFRVIHTSLDGVLTASAALLVPITYIPPSPRQPIRGLSPQPWRLGESLHCAASG